MSLKIEKTIQINASKEKVWEVLTQYPHRNIWMSEFSPNSVVEGEWKLGEVLTFKDDSGMGMQEEVVDQKDNEYTKMKVVGVLNNGKVEVDSEEAKQWAGDLETYTLTEENGVTTLTVVSFAPTEEMQVQFNELWEKGIKKIKEIAESNV